MIDYEFESAEVAELAIWYLGSPQGVVATNLDGGRVRVSVPEDIDSSILTRPNWEENARYAARQLAKPSAAPIEPEPKTDSNDDTEMFMDIFAKLGIGLVILVVFAFASQWLFNI